MTSREKYIKLAMFTLAGPVGLLVIIAPIEIVYHLGGTLTQALIAEGVFFSMISGFCCGMLAIKNDKDK